jgi:S1-C subfamily serine protease
MREVIEDIDNPFGFDTTMTVGVISAQGRKMVSVSRLKIRPFVDPHSADNRESAIGSKASVAAFLNSPFLNISANRNHYTA